MTQCAIAGSAPEVRASPDSGGVAVGKGDSGGAVYYGNADGTVRGTGTNSALDNEVTCPPGTTRAATTCGSTVYYADLPKALTFYGATISTS
jgi:hypothetical protein